MDDSNSSRDCPSRGWTHFHVLQAYAMMLYIGKPVINADNDKNGLDYDLNISAIPQVRFSLKFCPVALQKILTLVLPYWNIM